MWGICQELFCNHVDYFLSGQWSKYGIYSFKGTNNFKLRRDGIAEHTLDFEASLAEGEMNVYIGVDGEKELLLTVKGGESYDETITLDDKYDNEKTIYIILESVGKCVDGDFEFEYN